jgi:hypothetical protein
MKTFSRGHFQTTFDDNEVFTIDGQVIKDRTLSSLANKDNYPDGKCSLHKLKSDCHSGNMLILIMTRHRLGFIIWGEYVEKSKVGHGLVTDRNERRKIQKRKAEDNNKKKVKKNRR